MIIADESAAVRAGDPKSRIVDLRIDEASSGIGNCGQHELCGFRKLYACYTCRSFQPWLDGPHEQVLDFLIEERERKLHELNPRIATVLDRTILAVADVIQQCKSWKG